MAVQATETGTDIRDLQRRISHHQQALNRLHLHLAQAQRQRAGNDDIRPAQPPAGAGDDYYTLPVGVG